MDYQKVEALKASENYAICEIVSGGFIYQSFTI